MKPRARLGMALLLLGGCHTARNLSDVQLPDFFTQANPPAAAAPRNPAPASAGAPAYVMVTSATDDRSAPVANIHMNLPAPAAMPTSSPFGPVTDLGSTRATPANQPALSVLNSTAKQAAPAPPPPTPPEGSTPILASIQDPPPGSPIDRDLSSVKVGARPISNELLGGPGSSPTLPTAATAPAPAANDTVAMAPEKPAAGVALTGTVEEDGPSATATPTLPPVTKLFADPVPPLPAWPMDNHASPASAPAAGPEIRLVNSKRISLNYEVKDGGAAGPTEVELWYTHDGRNWKKKETLPQGKPPCVVDVEDEDLYGFTLLVHRAGTRAKRPQEGDKPQVWVEVDVTKPTVWLLDVEAGKGAEGRQATISWKAADKNLSARPMTLSYAAGPEGPWMPFASQLENTGHYLWQIPRDVPPHFLVRVEAIDRAGNMGIAQTPQALGEDPAQPTAAILKVEGAQK